MPRKGKPRLTLEGFPDALHLRFKSLTAAEGTSMVKTNIELVTAWCEQAEARRARKRAREETTDAGN